MKIAVGISGASGSIYAQILLKTLQQYLGSTIQEIGVVWSQNAKTVWQEELSKIEPTAFDGIKEWKINDFYAPFASGSAGYDALIICPCSMGTLGRIASGISDNLITRAADVMLKERKKLICVVREMPYNLIQINNMKSITEAGGIICPTSPSFYSKPQTIQQAVQTVIDRVIHLAGIGHQGFKWGG